MPCKLPILLASASVLAFAVDLATDGTPIVISTNGGTCGAGSAICFEIKKANHNGIDRVRIGGTTVVTSGASTGFVIVGPDQTSGTVAGKTACSPDTGGSACTNVLSSANDAGSTCSVESNGPVKAVIVCTFDHEDGSSNAYMHETVRYYFYAGSSAVRIMANLRNADDGANNSFASAYKGHRGWELRTALNISGTLDYKIAKHSGTETGTVATADAVRLYQAQSNWPGSACTADCGMNTDDVGYEIVKTVSGTPSTLATGTISQYPVGWMDIADSSGIGATIGAHLMAGREMESLEWTNGEARIGLKTPHNTWDSTYTGYYEAWPQHSIREVWIGFHATAPSSPGNNFLMFQHPLKGRVPESHFNNTGVFGFKVPTAAEEYAWYVATEATASPDASPPPADLVDKYPASGSSLLELKMHHAWFWGAGGSSTQADHRIDDMLSWNKRGFGGRWLDAENFYKAVATMNRPFSDGFTWRDDADIDFLCRPTITSVNSSKSVRNWVDQEHAHWYGLIYYYLMTGEEWAKDGIDAYKDLHGCGPLALSAANFPNNRSVGSFLSGSALLAEFLTDTDDADVTDVLTASTTVWELTAKATLCINGDGTGCTYAYDGAGSGINRARGVRRGGQTDVEVWVIGDLQSTWCGSQIPGTVGWDIRATASFQTSTFLNGSREFRRVKGPDWADYTLAGDLNYGVARYNAWENYVDDGSGRWDQSGFNYYVLIDAVNECLGYTGSGVVPVDPDDYHFVGGRESTHETWPEMYRTEGTLSSWISKIRLVWHQLCAGLDCEGAVDYGGYQMGNVIWEYNNPTGTLTNVALTNFADNGGGSYTIQWTVPADTQYYRIKYHTTRIITDWLNYNKYTGTYGTSPSTHAPWFAATEASNIPGPAPVGTTQSLTISTGQTGLTADNFSVRAMVEAPSTFSTKVNPGMRTGMGSKIQ